MSGHKAPSQSRSQISPAAIDSQQDGPVLTKCVWQLIGRQHHVTSKRVQRPFVFLWTAHGCLKTGEKVKHRLFSEDHKFVLQLPAVAGGVVVSQTCERRLLIPLWRHHGPISCEKRSLYGTFNSFSSLFLNLFNPCRGQTYKPPHAQTTTTTTSTLSHLHPPRCSGSRERVQYSSQRRTGASLTRGASGGRRCRRSSCSRLIYLTCTRTQKPLRFGFRTERLKPL